MCYGKIDRYIGLILFISIFAGCSQPEPTPAQQIQADSTYTLRYVWESAGKYKSQASRILDSIDRREAACGYSTYPIYKIELMRAYVASRDLRPHEALRILHRLFPSPEIDGDDESYLFATNLLGNEYQIINRQDESAKYMLLHIDRAKKCGQYARYAVGLVNFWGINGLSDPAEAIRQIRQAREIMRAHPDVCDSIQIIWSLAIESDIHCKTKNYPEAIRLQQQILDIYERMTPASRKGTEVESDNHLYFKQAEAKATLAYYYALAGQAETAADYFSRAEQQLAPIPKVISPELYNTIQAYLQYAGRPRDALRYALEYEKLSEDAENSLNQFTKAAKSWLSDIYGALGDYRRAWQYEREASAITDSLNRQENARAAIELATAYQTAEQQAQLISQQQVLIRSRFWIGLLCTGLTALLIVSLLIWRYARRTSQKNRALFNQLQSLDRIKADLYRANRLRQTDPAEKQSTPGANSELFNQLEEYMARQEPYLHPDLTREQVAAALNTNKLYLANVIQESRSQTFGEYINLLRLEHARRILMYDYQTKIEAIAINSGFNSVRTFYRLFQKTYQLTPSEFRNIAILRKKERQQETTDV